MRTRATVEGGSWWPAASSAAAGSKQNPSEGDKPITTGTRCCFCGCCTCPTGCSAVPQLESKTALPAQNACFALMFTGCVDATASCAQHVAGADTSHAHSAPTSQQ